MVSFKKLKFYLATMFSFHILFLVIPLNNSTEKTNHASELKYKLLIDIVQNRAPYFPMLDKSKIANKKGRNHLEHLDQQEKNEKQQKEVLDKYYAEVSRIISLNKNFPPSAKKLGLEGDVNLVFEIHTPNIIKNISLKSYSEYDVFNYAAIELVKNIKNLPMIPLELKKDKLVISLPINYRAL